MTGKKINISGLFIILFFMVFPFGGYGQGADGIINKYLRQIGGGWKVKRLDDLTLRLDVYINGVPFEAYVYYKNPNRYKQVLLYEGDTVQVQVFDGKRAGAVELSQLQEMAPYDEKSFRIQAYLFPEAYMKELQLNAQLIGPAKLNGNPAQEVEFTDAQGYNFTAWYHAGDDMKMRTVYPIGDPLKDQELQVDILRYRKIGGIAMPLEKRITTAGFIIRMELTATSRKEIPESMFVLPENSGN